MSVAAPFPWFGGKRRIAHVVWQRFGDVPNYVEPFAGSVVAWKAHGGYGGQRKHSVNDNRERERIWFSPHCLTRQQRGLFDAAEAGD